MALQINRLYRKEDKWEEIDQVRENHYQHVFKTNSPFFPGEDEPYLAKFDRSTTLEKSEEINKLYATHFRPALSEVSGKELSEFDIRCYQLKQGDFYRTHIDDYAGKVGMIYYINEKWIWDWGGILHVGSDQDDKEITAILPVFNRAMIIDHEKFRFPHFISGGSYYAQNQEYSILYFNKYMQQELLSFVFGK